MGGGGDSGRLRTCCVGDLVQLFHIGCSALTKSGRQRKERPEDLDVPAALADFIHQQRTQKTEQDM